MDWYSGAAGLGIQGVREAEDEDEQGAPGRVQGVREADRVRRGTADSLGATGECHPCQLRRRPKCERKPSDANTVV